MNDTQTIDTETKRPTDPALLAWAKELCREVAPELFDFPVYLVDHPAHLPTPLRTTAYAVTGRHIGLHDWLVGRGLYNGAGPCIVLVGVPAPKTELDRRAFAGVVVHELAHCLPFTPLPWIEPTAAERDTQGAVLAAWSAEDDLPKAEPWRDHDAPFIRRALHMQHRAMWAGVPIPAAWLKAGGPQYGLSHADEYLVALGSEPFKLRHASFAEIAAEPAPPAFTGLFENDVKCWKFKQKERIGDDDHGKCE